MNGREDSKQNDLFFLCSLIEYIGRQTKNERSVIVNALGRKGLEHYYELAEVYHCENIDKVTDEIINKYGIVPGHYDNVSKAEDGIPTHWDIGKVVQRIILKLADNSDGDIISALIKVYNSWIITKLMTIIVLCIMRIQVISMNRYWRGRPYK